MTPNEREMFYGVAVDAGSGLEAAIKNSRGPRAQGNDLLAFKRAVVEELGPEASTMLVDATCGPELLGTFPENCARMLAYEADVYHISDDDRMTVLPDNITVADYPKMGVKLLKFFMYYAPDDTAEVNARKHELVQKIGEECRTLGIRYLMEPLVYHPSLQAGTAEYAAIKPDLVRRATETFADPKFAADVLKVEVPVDLNYVDGFGESDMSVEEAMQAFRDAAAPAKNCKLVYLSAGVSFEWFEASLRMAREAGVDFNGFMCGRAIWSDAVEVFGSNGEEALRNWLSDKGSSRLRRLIAAVN